MDACVRRALATVALAALTACGGGDAPEATKDRRYDTVEDLKAGLNAGGVPCATDRVHHDFLPRVDTMTCDDAGGPRYVLVVWEGERPADLLDVLGPSERVQGPNWIVQLRGPEPVRQGERVREAIGGAYHPLRG